jgi:hypothetical protein
MKRFVLTTALLLSLCASAMAQTGTDNLDMQRFELTPTAPPSPALKYQFLFRDAFERRPGNAAILYMYATLLMGPDAEDKADKALEAYDGKNMARFNNLADSLENHSVLEELDLAGRCENCDWEFPWHEEGLGTLLPQLSPLRTLGRILKVRALREIDQGKIDDAVQTMRLGYEMADKVGEKGVLVCGLISMSISLNMNDCLEQLMNRPDAPNLYWALSGFPNRQAVLSASIDGESQWWVNAIPNLAQAWRGEDISAQQWHAMLDYLHSTVGGSHPNVSDVVKATSPELMRQAQEQYAQTHHITPEQAAGVDPIIVVGTFYLSQLQIARDNAFKLRGLAVPTRIAMSKKAHDDFEKLMREQPANPFLQTLSDFHGIYVRFARIDRLLAALTTVEAIRSYAAANNGELPAQLSDITDTPVPLNPATGEPFEYRTDNGTATLSDSKFESRLTYTIRIRK